MTTVLHPLFLGCGGSGTGAPGSLRTNVPVAGLINGTNKVFTTPDLFVHDGVADEAVYLRGLRMLEGAGSDYVASESGGPGSGYDTLTFARAPRVGDNILCDYYVAP